jgi:hypothetical protein
MDAGVVNSEEEQDFVYSSKQKIDNRQVDTYDIPMHESKHQEAKENGSPGIARPTSMVESEQVSLVRTKSGQEKLVKKSRFTEIRKSNNSSGGVRSHVESNTAAYSSSDLTSQTNLSQKGTYMEDSIENKTYLIKSSGTIIDINRHPKKVRKIPMSVRKPVSQYVAFLKSPFKNRGPVMFYAYPSYVGEDKEDYGRLFYRHQSDIDQYIMRFKISDTTNIYNAVVNTCKAAGMLLVNERFMLRKKKQDQGLTSSDSSEDDDYKDEFEDDYNVLFTGAVKEEILK